LFAKLAMFLKDFVAPKNHKTSKKGSDIKIRTAITKTATYIGGFILKIVLVN
jgi:hypothetical protein